MSIKDEIKIIEFPGVCQPAEDTFLLAKTASLFPRGKALDMGTGTGYIAIYLAKLGFDVDAVDVNEKALKNTRENAQRNGIALNIYYSSLFDHVKATYDLIVFNPPRIPNNAFINHIGSFVRRHPLLVGMAIPFVKLFFGQERLSLILLFIKQSPQYLKKTGRLLLYLAQDEIKKIEHELQESANIEIFQEMPEKYLETQIVSIQFIL